MPLYTLNKHNIIPVNTKIEELKDGIRVIKSAKIEIPDENTYAKLKDVSFHNGTISLTMHSRLLPDAPAHARGFIGIAFRIQENDDQFESFYVRPTNGRDCTDPVRRQHGCQYFSYPGYTFSYFRDNNITAYEAPADIALDEDIRLKAVIHDSTADFFVNDVLTLHVEEMLSDKEMRGSVGFFTDIGTDACFTDCRITFED